MRKLIYFSLFVLLSFTCLADLGIQNSESVTTDVTRYIRINSGTDFTNYTIDVRWTDQVWCYQETANGTNDCWGLDTGSYYANTSDGITDPKQWDEIWWYNDLGSGI